MRRSPVFLLVLSFILSCKTVQVPVKADYFDYPISNTLPVDSSLEKMLVPYRDSVNRSMSDVVGYVETTLDKKQPEGTLGNFMADAMFHMAQKKFGYPVDVATVNYGGIRLLQIPVGIVTRGKIFELSPFDNLVVIQNVRGDTLQSLLDMTAERGGWPFAGLTMQISNNKAVNVMIGGKPIDHQKIYKLVSSDYLANGGDNATMLKAIPQQSIGYLVRDALFDYIKALKAEGKNITAKEEKRVYAQ